MISINMEFKKYKLFHPEYADVDYKKATEIIIKKGLNNESFAVSALAVHGLIESLKSPKVKQCVSED